MKAILAAEGARVARQAVREGLRRIGPGRAADVLACSYGIDSEPMSNWELAALIGESASMVPAIRLRDEGELRGQLRALWAG
jgi:hypothetical protein